MCTRVVTLLLHHPRKSTAINRTNRTIRSVPSRVHRIKERTCALFMTPSTSFQQPLMSTQRVEPCEQPLKKLPLIVSSSSFFLSVVFLLSLSWPNASFADHQKLRDHPTLSSTSSEPSQGSFTAGRGFSEFSLKIF